MREVCEHCTSHEVMIVTIEGGRYEDGCFCLHPEVKKQKFPTQHHRSCHYYGADEKCPFFTEGGEVEIES